MALSIMFYHLTSWIYSPLDASGPLGRLGIYAVSIFFVLSGLSMALVYNKFISSAKNSLQFFLRRIFRIWPLLWMACFLYVLFQLIVSGSTDWKMLLKNITTIFGFTEPGAYIIPGAWSIGNEMVYYALTPGIILLYNFRQWTGNLAFILSLAIGLYFGFHLLSQEKTLAEQWATYINPFNNLFLYMMGIAIYYNFRNIEIRPILNNILLLLAILLFTFLPFEGNQILIVSGVGRLVFVALSFVIVLCFFKLKINLPGFASKGLEKLGLATYGVYLVHPVIFLYLNYLWPKTGIDNKLWLFALISVVTVTLALISYTWVETWFIKKGKTLTTPASNK
ncbi:MAG: acyltransferase [Bacteroidetes bacterium HGW-Bacteroidetes-21]|jgi:peptidoglycan/LPS O-acetylase OafA/YrhL|nr:MAG: acyltransferase [Bacteroidetes bacterium HGW-Bacteroidetes-21]